MEDADELLYDAAMLIISTGQASTSFLQRRLAIGNPPCGPDHGYAGSQRRGRRAQWQQTTGCFDDSGRGRRHVWQLKCGPL